MNRGLQTESTLLSEIMDSPVATVRRRRPLSDCAHDLLAKRLFPGFAYVSENQHTQERTPTIIPTPNRKVLGLMQPIAIELEHQHEKQENPIMPWFFGESSNVRVGIEKDRKKLLSRLKSEKAAYKDYISWTAGRRGKLIADMELRIATLESEVEEFPQMVVQTMCQDVANMISRGRGGALGLMKDAGTCRVYGDLMASYVNRWKTILYRRGVFEYLVQTGEESRWGGLIFGMQFSRAWLASNFEDMMGQGVLDKETTVFIVEILFPAVDMAKVDMASMCLKTPRPRHSVSTFR